MKRFLIGVLLAAIILGVGFSNNNKYITIVSEAKGQVPTINIVSNVSPLSQNEFVRIGTKEIPDPKIDDFRKFELKVELINSSNVRSKELVIPRISEFQQILTSDRLWSGSEVYQNNDGEDFSFAERKYVLYYKDLTDDRLKELLSPLEFHVSWIDSNGDKTFMNFKLTDYLIFNNHID